MVTNFLKRCFRRFRGSQKGREKKYVCPISFEEKIGFCCQHKKFSVLRKKIILPWKKKRRTQSKEFLFLNSLFFFTWVQSFFGYRKQQIQTKVFVDTSKIKSAESSIFFLLRSSVKKMTVITKKGVIGDDHRVLLILLDNFDDLYVKK